MDIHIYIYGYIYIIIYIWVYRYMDIYIYILYVDYGYIVTGTWLDPFLEMLTSISIE
jgi:hypothetical protein